MNNYITQANKNNKQIANLYEMSYIFRIKTSNAYKKKGISIIEVFPFNQFFYPATFIPLIAYEQYSVNPCPIVTVIILLILYLLLHYFIIIQTKGQYNKN